LFPYLFLSCLSCPSLLNLHQQYLWRFKADDVKLRLLGSSQLA
jgi:hypothetical protein